MDVGNEGTNENRGDDNMPAENQRKDEWFPTKNYAIILNEEQSKEFREWANTPKKINKEAELHYQRCLKAGKKLFGNSWPS